MDALDLLKQQHREVESLFAALEDGDDSIRADIAQKLTKHAELEESYFYPALESNDKTAKYVPHARGEHQEVKDLIEEWKNSDDFMGLAGELEEAVMHHVEEEEGEMFTVVREAFTQQELDELGEVMASK